MNHVKSEQQNQQDLFDSLFNPQALKACFDDRFVNSTTRGLDNMTGSQFAKLDQDVFDVMSNKILSGQYRFTPYSEKLVSKGRHKAPRLIAIATIRDRIVLRQLNRFLQQQYAEFVPQPLPKRTIENVLHKIAKIPQDQIWVYKGDIKRFYDEIPHAGLITTLEKNIDCRPIIGLIHHALMTPTVPKLTPRKSYYRFKPTKGVPQGLSISNRLANIYLNEADSQIKTLFPDIHYFRFVDDILIFGHRESVIEAERWLSEKMASMGLELHGDDTKRHFKSMDDGFEFLGYVFKNQSRSVRESSLSRLHLRLVKFITAFKHEFSLTSPTDEDIEVFVEHLNYRITGLVCEETKRHFGWIAYYHHINDLRVLYALDALVIKLLKQTKIFPEHQLTSVKSYVRSHFVTNFEMHDQDYIPVLKLGKHRKEQLEALKKLGLDIEDDFVYMDG